MATYLRPQHGAGRSASYEAVVENRGNAPIVARLAAVDERQALELKVSEPAISVPPGGAGVAWVHAQPGARPLPGQPTTYAFRVTAQVGSDPPQSVDAQFVYKPALPLARRKWLPVLRIVLTLLGGLLMISGATGPWVDDVAGVDLTYEGYVETVFGGDVASPPEGLSTSFVAVGLVAIILGVVAVLGVFSRTGMPTRMAGVLAVVLMLAFVFTVMDADVSLGSGPLVVLAGAVLALLGGIAGRVRKP
jgi:vacuolar-type H+-ATPase subunit I/STV1